MNKSLHDASEAATQMISSPKVQGSIGTAVATLGGYNMVETAQSVLGLVSLIIGILVGLYALVNAHKASKRADAELQKINLEIERLKK